MRQKGFTLVELMVGLVISLLCMAMMMMLFKQITRTGAEAARAAEYDAQLETSLLIVQKLVQNAGYGSGASDDVATAAYSGGGNALYWRTAPNLSAPANYECKGIAEKIEASGTRYIHRLLLLDSAACAAGDLTAKTWALSQTMISIKAATVAPIFSFSVAGNCSPFGTANVQGAKKVVISATREDIGTGALGKNVQRAVCLNNILISTP